MRGEKYLWVDDLMNLANHGYKVFHSEFSVCLRVRKRHSKWALEGFYIQVKCQGIVNSLSRLTLN